MAFAGSKPNAQDRLIAKIYNLYDALQTVGEFQDIGVDNREAISELLQKELSNAKKRLAEIKVIKAYRTDDYDSPLVENIIVPNS